MEMALQKIMKKSKVYHLHDSQYFPFLLLLIIVFFAFFLRSKMILHGDFYYLVDQARDLLLTKGIVVDHKLTLIGPRTGLGGLFHGPLWLYMLTPFFVLAKGNPFWTLIPLFELVSLSLIFLGFFVGAKLYGKSIGLLLALLLTISSPLVETVPYTTNAQMQPFVFLLFLYSTIEFIRGKQGFFLLSAFCIGIGFQFESAFAVTWIPLLILAMILRKKLPSLKNLLLSGILLLIGLSTFILFDLRHQFLMTKSFLHLITTPSKPLPGYEQYSSISFRVLDRLEALKNGIFTPLFSGNIIIELILLVILVWGVYMVITSYVRDHKLDKEFLFILLTPLVIYTLYIFYPFPLWPHYLLSIAVIFSLLLAMSIQKIYKKSKAQVLIGIFLLLAIISPVMWLYNAYIANPGYTPTSDGSYRNQLSVASWLVETTKGQPYGYFVYTPGILTYNMDYLLWWKSRKEGLLAPSNQKHPDTFLIMYPSQAKDTNAHNYWKKNVLHTRGKVVYTRVFNGDITVQKLNIPANDPQTDPNYYQNLIFR